MPHNDHRPSPPSGRPQNHKISAPRKDEQTSYEGNDLFFSHTKSLSNLGKKAVEYTASKSDRKARKKYIREDKEELAIIVTTMSRLPTTMYMSRNIVNNSLCPVGSGVRLRKINSMTLLLCLIYSSVCIVSKSLQKRKYYEF